MATTELQRILMTNSETSAATHAALLLRAGSDELARVAGHADGDTALLLAARYNAFHLVRATVAAQPECVRCVDGRGGTVLHTAAAANAREVIEELLPLCSRGDIDINARDADGATAIMVACRCGYQSVESLLSSHVYCIRDGSRYAGYSSLSRAEWDSVLAALHQTHAEEAKERRVVVAVPGQGHLQWAVEVSSALIRALRHTTKLLADASTHIVCPHPGTPKTPREALTAMCAALVRHLRTSDVHYALVYISDRELAACDASLLSAYVHPVVSSSRPCMVVMNALDEQQEQKARGVLEGCAKSRDPLAGPFFGFVAGRARINVLEALARALANNPGPMCESLESDMYDSCGAGSHCIMTHIKSRIDDALARSTMSWAGAGLRVMRESEDGRTVTLAAGRLLALPAGVYECRYQNAHVATLLVTPRQLSTLVLDDGSSVPSQVCSTASVAWRVRGCPPLEGCVAALVTLAGTSQPERVPVYCDSSARCPRLLGQLLWHADAAQFILPVVYPPLRGITVSCGRSGYLEARDSDGNCLLLCQGPCVNSESELIHNITTVVRYRELLKRMRAAADDTAAGNAWLETCFVVLDNDTAVGDSSQIFAPHTRVVQRAGERQLPADRFVPVQHGRTLSTVFEPNVAGGGREATLFVDDLVYLTARNFTAGALYARVIWFSHDGGIAALWPPHNDAGLLPPGQTVRINNLASGVPQPWQIGVEKEYASMPFSVAGPGFVREHCCLVVAHHPFSLAYAHQASCKNMKGMRSRGSNDDSKDSPTTQAGYGDTQVYYFGVKVRASRI